MSSSILDTVLEALTPDFVEKAAASLGEPGAAVSKGVRAAAPLMLGSLGSRADNASLMSTVFDLIRSPDNDPGILDNPSKLIGKGLPAMALGGKLLRGLFGDRVDDVGRSLGGYAGMSAKGGSSLLGLAAPLLLGALGKIVRSQNLDLGALIKLLLGQKDEVSRAIPGPLRQLVGLGAAPAAERRAPVVVEKKSSIWRWLGPLLIALLGLWLLSKLFGGKDEQDAMPSPALEVEEVEVVEAEPVEPAKPVAPVEPAKPETEAEPETAAAKPVELEEPEPLELEEPELAAEPETVETTKTVTVVEEKVEEEPIRLGEPDRHTIAGVPTADIYFTADSADVPTGAGRSSLDDVIAYMKAHPDASAKIAGYHASTGDLDHNKDLAHQRAAAVQTAMKKAGIAKDRTEIVEPITTQGSPVDKYARRVAVSIEP